MRCPFCYIGKKKFETALEKFPQKDEVGLEFNIEESILANSLNAHRLIQFAKTKGLGNEIEEALFKAHFTEKKNIDNTESLLEIGVSIGLDEKETREMLNSNVFAYEVKQDEHPNYF